MVMTVAGMNATENPTKALIRTNCRNVFANAKDAEAMLAKVSPTRTVGLRPKVSLASTAGRRPTSSARLYDVSTNPA